MAIGRLRGSQDPKPALAYAVVVSTLEIQVRGDGAVFIPASEVAFLGIKPGETLAVEFRLHPAPR